MSSSGTALVAQISTTSMPRMQQRAASRSAQQQHGTAATARWRQQPRRVARPPRQRISPAAAAAGGAGSSGGGAFAGLSDDVVYSSEVPLSRLQEQLEAAVEQEDYEAAAALRDVLQRRRFDARLAVEEANDCFYKAFQSGSLAAMGEIWGKGEHVQCIHPLGSCIAGRAQVMESWRVILGAGRLKIGLEDVRVYASDSHTYVTCVEVMESTEGRGRIAATNVFEKQGGRWKLVHHHGSPASVGR